MPTKLYFTMIVVAEIVYSVGALYQITLVMRQDGRSIRWFKTALDEYLICYWPDL